jgi:hypothetical protein
MLLFDGAVGIVLLALWLFCLIDVIVTDEYSCRNLPKMLWLVIVLILPDVGSVLWLILGRPRDAATPATIGARGRAAYVPPATNPDDDEEFMRQVRQRAEEQRRRAREQSERRDPPDPAHPLGPNGE